VRRSLAAAALAAALVSGGSAAAHAARAHSASTAVGVGEREFRVYPYRTKVRPGTVRFNVNNLGEDVHNLQVRGPRGYRSKTSPDIRSGDGYTLVTHLRRAGRYTLICTKAGHARRGMKATFTVSRH
jgi:plastocyanin